MSPFPEAIRARPALPKTVLSGKFMGFGMDFAAGMLSGTMTSTPAMQAAMESAGNSNPAIACAIAYPFGVIGPILCFYLFNRLVRPKVDLPAPSRLVVAEARAGERGIAGLTIAELLQRVPKDLELLEFRRAGMNMPLDPSIRLEAEDLVAIAGLPKAISGLKLGNSEEVRSDRRYLDYVRCFVSKPEFVGTKLSDLKISGDFSAKIMQVRRGDVDVLPSPGLVIEYGDQVGVLVEPAGRDTGTPMQGPGTLGARLQSATASTTVGRWWGLARSPGTIPTYLPV